MTSELIYSFYATWQLWREHVKSDILLDFIHGDIHERSCKKDALLQMPRSWHYKCDPDPVLLPVLPHLLTLRYDRVSVRLLGNSKGIIDR